MADAVNTRAISSNDEFSCLVSSDAAEASRSGHGLPRSVGISQSQVQRTLGDLAAVERIAGMLAHEQFESRRALGRRICAEFDFHDRLVWERRSSWGRRCAT